METASSMPGRLPDTLGVRFSARTTGGFDYLRIVLAVAVVYWHTWAVVLAGIDSPPLWIQIIARAILPVFFGLSGYLVASSLERTAHLPVFLYMRFLRIFPALVVETILSALLLGPLVTTLALGDYFTHPVFLDYFHNLYGNVRYYLPGVFESQPYTKVNASIWTVPFELECYVALSGLYLFGLYRNKWILLASVLAVGALFAWQLRDLPDAEGLVMPGRVLVMSFLFGNVIYKFRESLPAGALVGAVMTVLTMFLMRHNLSMIPAAFTAAYAAAALGSTNPWRAPIIFNGDYSYGVYLYAFPIQQLVYWLFGSRSMAFNFFASMLLISLWAAFSWHAIEKPTLKLKRIFDKKKPGKIPESAAPAE